MRKVIDLSDVQPNWLQANRKKSKKTPTKTGKAVLDSILQENNPYHGEDGKFTTKDGGSGSGGGVPVNKEFKTPGLFAAAAAQFFGTLDSFGYVSGKDYEEFVSDDTFKITSSKMASDPRVTNHLKANGVSF